MATSPGRNLPDVIHGILDFAACHDFTQIAYLFEQHWPGQGKMGDGIDRWRRFRPASETSFPAVDIRRCRYDDQGRLDIQLNFIGFYEVDAAVLYYFSDRVLQFQPQRIRVKNDIQLGSGELRVGENTLLGEDVLDVSGKIEVVISPIEPQACTRFMPTTLMGCSAIDLAKRYLPPGIEFDLVIQITSGATVAEPLGSDQLVLGWSTWLQDKAKTDWQARISGCRTGMPTINRIRAA